MISTVYKRMFSVLKKRFFSLLGVGAAQRSSAVVGTCIQNVLDRCTAADVFVDDRRLCPLVLRAAVAVGLHVEDLSRLLPHGTGAECV